MKKIFTLIFVMMLWTLSSWAQTYLTESFEGTWSGTPAAPAGWTIIHTAPSTSGSGTSPMYWVKNTWSGTAWSTLPYGGAPTTPTGSYDLSSVAWFNDGNAMATQKDQLSTGNVDLSTSINPRVTFYLACSASSSLTLKLRGSADGGATWADIQTLAKPGVAWTKMAVTIPAMYKVANARFGFEVTTTWGSYDVFLDKIVIQETPTPVAISSTALGGLWSSPATWVGGIIPDLDASPVIVAGATVVVNQSVVVGDLTIDGKLQWLTSTAPSGTVNTLQANNITIGTTGVLYAHGTVAAGATLKVTGNFTNNGVANLAIPTTGLYFNGTSGTQTLGGTGTFLADMQGRGMIANLFFSSLAACNISTTQNIVTSNLAHTAGSLNTNGKLSIDNTAICFGGLINRSIATVTVNIMGAGYTSAPTVAFTAAPAGGITATGVANFDAATGTVRSITITNAGDGYRAAPTVTLTGGGFTTTATAVAALYQVFNFGTNSLGQKSAIATVSGSLNIKSDQSVGSVWVTNGGTAYTSAPTVGFSLPTGYLNLVTAGGSGYTAAPTVTFTGGGGTGAVGAAVVCRGKVVSVNITTAGTGYTSAPVIGFTGGGAGTGATAALPVGALPTATATIDAVLGMVTSFTITNGGFGYTAAPTVTLTGGGGTGLAGATARIGLYNLTLNYFAPATTNATHTESVFIPTNRRINFLTLAATGFGFNLTNDLELYNSSPITLTGGNFNLGGYTLTFSHPTYTGASGSATAYVTNGKIAYKLFGSSSAQTRTFPFNSYDGVSGFNNHLVSMGNAALVGGDGSTITTLTGSMEAAPSGTNMIGTRTLRLQTNGGLYGNLPTVRLNWNSVDALAVDAAFFSIAQASAVSGPWTVRSVPSGSGLVNPAGGNRTTATTGVGPFVPTGDDYFGWCNNLPSTPTLNTNLTSLAFGFIANGNTSTAKSYVVSGLALTTSPITVVAPAGFEVTLDTTTTWSSSVNVGFTPPLVTGTTVYVHFKPLAAGVTYTGNVTNDCAGATTKNVAVTGNSDLNSVYCVPTSVYGCTDGDVIARVQLNTLDNNSGTGCPSGAVGYSNYTSNPLLTTTLMPSSTYGCTVWAGQYGEGYAAWIDYNDDGVFDNVTERVGYSNGQVAGSGTVGVLGSSATFPIALACSPPAGTHRLRVRCMFNTNGVNVTPCTTNSYGEIEDYNITITGAPACASPGTATVTPTAHTIALAITLNCSNATHFDFEYGPIGFVQGSGILLSNQLVSIAAGIASYSITGLPPTTAYDVYYRADCGGGNYSPWSLKYTTTTLLSCFPPTALTAVNMTTNSADLGWTDPTATIFNIKYGVGAFDPLTAGTLVSGVTNPHTLGGLTASTTYDYYVQADCGAIDGYSTWAGPFVFSTACDILTTFPYLENFNSAVAPLMPACISVIDGNADGDKFVTNATYGISSTPGAVLYTDYNAGANNDYLVLPHMTLTGNQRLKFSYRSYSATEPNDFDVVMSTTGNLPADFTTILLPLTQAPLATFTETAFIDLSAYSGDVYIAIHVPAGGLDGWYFIIDDIIVEDIPSCVYPSLLTATNIGVHQADLGWTADPSQSAWEIEYVPTGTTPSGVANALAASNPFTLTGLNASQGYDFYVRADCGGGLYSTWVGPHAFTTVKAITASPASLAFGFIPNNTLSTEQSYTLSGIELTGTNLVVTAPAGFGVSLTTGGPYTSTVDVAVTPPTLAATTIYVHFAPTIPLNDYMGDITNVDDADFANVVVTGTTNVVYCTSIAAYTGDEEIYSVTLNGATNAYNCTTVAPGPGSLLNRYSNFTTLGPLTSLQTGTTVSFTIEENECDGASYYYNGCAVWIDWNHNGILNDPGEEVYVENATSQSPRTISGSFLVPSGAVLGNTRMRIIVSEGSSGASLQPCMTYSWGETEDYTVTVTPPSIPYLTAQSNFIAFGYVAPNVLSPEQSYLLSGNLLTAGPIVVTAPADFGVSLTSGGPYTSSLIVSYPLGTLDTTRIFVQFAPGVVPAMFSGNITNVGGSASVDVAVSGHSLMVYCVPTYTYGGGGDFVTHVTLGTLTQATASNVSPYYIDYTATQNAVPDLFIGVPNNLTLTFSTDGSQYNGVWIDFNQNGTFETTEFFTSGTNAGSSGTSIVVLTVPPGALTGHTRMRIRGGEDSQVLSTQPCGASSSGWGDAQDYIVNVIAPLAHDVATLSINMNSMMMPSSIIPQATVSNNGSNTETFDVTMTIGTYTSTKTVTALASYTSQVVSFDTWDAAIGNYTVNVCTGALTPADMDATNDCKTLDVTVKNAVKMYCYVSYNATATLPMGPAYFYDITPGIVTSLAPTTSAQFIQSATWANGTWYASEYTDGVTGGGWWSIDTLGNMSLLGYLGYSFTGLTYDHVAQKMYGVVYDAVNLNNKLYSINPVTGAVNLLDSMGLGKLFINLATDGTYLYTTGLGVVDSLFRIDPVTYALTGIGPTVVDLNYQQDMEYDYASNTMFATGTTAAITGGLYTVNLTTGAYTLVGGFQSNVILAGLAIPYQEASPFRTVNLHLFLEGLYNPTTGMMNEAYDGNTGEPYYGLGMGIADKIQVDLYEENPPYLPIGVSISGITLAPSGLASFMVSSTNSANYYIKVSTRNHLASWTSIAVPFNTPIVNWYFNTSLLNVYGSDPQVQVSTSPDAFAFYLGDLDQGGWVGSEDFNLFEPDLTAGSTGFYTADFDGGGWVGSEDFNLFEPRLTAGNFTEYPGKK